ncbi:exonuclease SbcCD subunit D [Fodinisporobacter ferrooxydans]|uniref:Nuclease SbcCD subunit D n=1 Tax=Fodinisporobacter ferrooxydans TaxID=2901836 RepID=A0ABY4CG30_9BACL|nr:exonuclease SbcCD subunit D [Alicyclobacillaceae bacterium MYW30-H2]
MKIFHTADWHLGKLVQGFAMTEDQRYVLDQFLDAVKSERPDAVIIAGDLYDRAVPPNEAVGLLDDVLTRLIVDMKTPVLMIAGNHDSPERIHFANSILKDQGLYIQGKLQKEMQPAILYDAHGPVHFYLVPYAEPGQVRTLLEDETIRTHNDAMQAIIKMLEPYMDPLARHVFIGHAFVTPSGEAGEYQCDSERPLAIGGAEYIQASHFQNFHYVALGHLHQAHHVGNERIRYAGSPLKYSISEEYHDKGFYSVELAADGNVQVDKRSLVPRRDVRSVAGLLDDIKQHDRCEDYVFVTLLDSHAVLFPMEHVRTVYPNAMHVTRKQSTAVLTDPGTQTLERHKMDSMSLFQAFYKEVKGTELPHEMETLFQEVLEDVLRREKGDV